MLGIFRLVKDDEGLTVAMNGVIRMADILALNQANLNRDSDISTKIKENR